MLLLLYELRLQLAGKKWLPNNFPASGWVYQHLIEVLVDIGATEAQAVAFTDEFFYGEPSQG